MKKIIMLAIAALPLFSIAQDKEKAAGTTATTAKTSMQNPEVIYMELICGLNNAGGTSIRADFGRDILTSLNDKEAIQQLSDMRSMTFASMPDAMNYLAAQGFKFQQNYETADKDGKHETHIVYEKRMPRKGQEGANKPTRPERPTEGTKPGTDVKPTEKTPNAKPGDKPKK